MTRRLAARRPDGSLDDSALAEAARLLREGALVAFPTETVYGLGAHALDPAAVARIFEAKGRPRFNPLIVHVPGAEQARALASRWPDTAERLVQAFWPGPLTVIVPRAACVPDEVNGGLDSVALRSPAHEVAHALLVAAGVPVAAPSANRFGSVSPTTAAHVLAGLEGRIDAVLDGGPCSVGIESTVIDLSAEQPVLLRPGGVSAEELERVVGPVQRPHLVLDSGPRASPGLTSRHYAPSAQVLLTPTEALAPTLASLPPDARPAGLVLAAPRPADARLVAWEQLGTDPRAYAQALYDTLHRLEAADATHILVEELPRTPAWEAVADRLQRAAAPAVPAQGAATSGFDGSST